ncbi:MAG TPA: branched-chain amino acid ABC transporter permease [Candidatus Limiplasma sp.]|nr:branched-chain amino acid ABC transporter permease [Candidatus Limiplasma sp.]
MNQLQLLVKIIPQLLSDGLALGFVYAIVALGYTMVYGILEFINFAHSELFMFGAFVGTEVLLFMQSTGLLPNMSPTIAMMIAIVVATVMSGGLGVAVDRIAYKPVRNAPKLVPFISAIGVSFILQDLVRMFEEAKNGKFYLNAPTLFTNRIAIMPNMVVPEKTLYIVGLCIIIMIALTIFVSKNKWGKAMRAVAQDRETARLMGINVDKVISLTFLIGAGMGGAAGTLFSIQYGSISPYSGFILGMKAFTAAVFGGIGKIPGAMLGGVLLGLIEVFGASFLGALTGGVFGSEYKDVLGFAILILILIFKPSGLLGKPVGEKV